MNLRVFLLSTIGALGLLSAVLSFIAEAKKLSEKDITTLASNECTHSKGPALGLGMFAAIAVLIAQIISNSMGGCICCDSRLNGPSVKRLSVAVAVSCLTLSWITFSIAFLLLVAGASINDKRDASDENLSTGCYVIKSGVFAGAAFASMTTAILGIVYNLQVFAIRQTMASAISGPIGGWRSSDVQISNTGQNEIMNEQSNTPMSILPVNQKETTKKTFEHRVTYPRSSISPGRLDTVEMTSPHYENLQSMRQTGNGETTHTEGPKQMRGTRSKKVNRAYRMASQTASASYNIDPSIASSNGVGYD
ncbi:hypothetical protein KP509_01G102000 [Ceratopteris richardii]|uniref:Uncharacterized protein n=1 Tax=Ceratopteris richardii TaxID=49495 RepID=A0A8T2VFS3_CERRI|nr:hypothetical protein KP509_01G102000 [Ceratopteris richardii]